MNKKDETKPEGSKPESVKPKSSKPGNKAKGKYVGQELKIKLQNGAEFAGLCTGERKINGGAQVFLKLNGLVSRYFNVGDIVK